MRMLNFAKRCFKELMRDPISLIFEIALPVFLLFIFQQIDLPSEVYGIELFTPSIMLFGLAFITLFSGTLIAKDRTSSFLIRLGASPMRSFDYIFGYILAIVPIIILQDSIFLIVALMLGLKFSVNIILGLLMSIVISILFISFGLIIGSLVSEKASGGVGSVIVQLVCFTSGMYFSRDLIGEVFAKVCEVLPFESSLNILKAVFSGNYDIVSTRNVIVFVLYLLISLVISILLFNKKMVSDSK